MQSGNTADGNGKDRISVLNQQLTLLKAMLELESMFDFSLHGSSSAVDQKCYRAAGEPLALQPIRTFKNVLAAGSKYFCALFTNKNFNDSQTNVHKTKDVSHECLKAMVEFLHKGEVHAETIQFAVDLLKAARYYQVEDLVLGCEAYLESHLKVDNGIDLWKFACQHDWSSTILSEIEKFIAKNLKLIVNESDFLTLNTEEICGLLSIKPITTSVSADICFQAAMAWLEHDPEKRKVSSAAVLNSIPLCPGILSRQVLLDACGSKAMSLFAKEKLLQLLAYRLDPDYSEFISVPDYVEPSSGPGVSTSSSIEELYFVGGFPKECRKKFLKYNVNRKEWVQLEPLPWDRYVGSAGVFGGDRLLVFGGRKDEAGTADVDEFNFSSFTWSKISALPVSGDWSACPSQQNAYLSNMDGKIITYSASTKGVAFKNDMPFKRCFHSVSLSAKLNAMYVADGFSGVGTNIKHFPRIDKYDIASGTWQSVGFAKIKCSDRASVLCGDELYLIGGFDRTKSVSIDKVEVCNVRTGKLWSMPDLPDARHACQATMLYNNVICVFGSCHTERVAAYDVREGKWTTGIIVPDMPVKNTHFGFAWK